MNTDRIAVESPEEKEALDSIQVANSNREDRVEEPEGALSYCLNDDKESCLEMLGSGMYEYFTKLLERK